jgi:hypothetical protein
VELIQTKTGQNEDQQGKKGKSKQNKVKQIEKNEKSGGMVDVFVLLQLFRIQSC